MASSTLPALRRALLYVPASSPRFLAKSLTLTSDNVTYDLEDSVTASMKPAARTALQEHLTSLSSRKETTMSEIAVRINAVSTPDALADIAAVAALPALDTLVIPKVNSAADLLLVEDAIRQAAPDRASSSSSRPIKLLALIESARAIMDLRAICAATPNLRGLIFAAEDFALDLSLRRSPRMREMLYARSAIVTAARAYRLESVIDAVCTRLSDPRQPQRQLVGVVGGGGGGGYNHRTLQDECRNGSGMGFNGKQCIHPAQVPIVQHLFSPDKTKIKQATRIVVADEKASAAGRGAWSLDGRMIDAPVVGKARAILARAKQCGIDVDAVREKFKDQNFE